MIGWLLPRFVRVNWHRFSLFFLAMGLFTACSHPRYIEEQEPIAMEMPQFQQGPVIVIDAGHGGKDLGTNSKSPHYEEKILTLDTAFLVEHYLQRMGYRTVLTRTEDVSIPLEKRSSIANDLGSKVFVSVHYNSAPSAQAHGIEVFYFNSEKNRGRARESKVLAQQVLNQVIDVTKAKSRGVKHGNLSVVRETAMPAVLIEGGFLTNSGERQKIFQTNYRRQLAWGVASGIDKYLKGH
ncbi:MAG: N-acetylmuramoyl-L-alanine amidase AmiC [Chlamydiae bacterium]|nr:N-acetylmuramoyl-L-alanine amidase AmiC [Chlamydiota bacterium]